MKHGIKEAFDKLFTNDHAAFLEDFEQEVLETFVKNPCNITCHGDLFENLIQ